MQAALSGKENQHESLCEELLRERAAVLSRAGFAVEDALELLMKVERQIEQKIEQLRLVQNADSDLRNLPDPRSMFEEINSMIDQFNTIRQRAEIQYYYLIVTREALGLRRHETVQRLYRIPPKKKKMQAIY
ncbi:MAG: hypothetical protein ABFD45_01195 [Smithella sp.]|mgnify:CR=1 FL=1